MHSAPKNELLIAPLGLGNSPFPRPLINAFNARVANSTQPGSGAEIVTRIGDTPDSEIRFCRSVVGLKRVSDTLRCT